MTEVLRISLLASSEMFGVQGASAKTYFRAVRLEGLVPTEEEVVRELQYLIDKSLVVSEIAESVSPEKFYRASATGRDYLATLGLSK